MPLEKNDDIKLHIDGVTSLGSAVGRYGGMAVFVRNAVPGDDITAHIIKTSKKYAVGVVKDVIAPSQSRIEPGCPVYSSCGGCSFRCMSYERELEAKADFVRHDMKAVGRVAVDLEKVIGADELSGYRNKAQYPVHIENGVFTAGFYAFKSHRVVAARECALQPPEFAAGLEAFAEWALESGVSSYDEKSGRGLLRHIYFRKAFGTGQIMACAVINGESLPNAGLLVSLLKNAVPGIESVAVNINKNKTNVILGGKTHILWGGDKITDILLGRKFVISAQSFYQVNHRQCEKLYSLAAEFAGLTGSETVLDMYCGAGTIGLTLACGCKMLYGVEIVESAVRNARENARLNGIENARFICADALKGAELLHKEGVRPDVAVLDPPRKGCQKEALDAVNALGVKRIVYVSCNSTTLARDIAALSAAGYTVRRLAAVDMFPRTPHIECVALIEKD